MARRVSKHRNIKQHALRRARQRISPNMRRKDLSDIRKMIQSERTEHVYRQSNAITHHLVRWKGEEYVAVYDKNRKLVKTVLYWEQYKKRRSR